MARTTTAKAKKEEKELNDQIKKMQDLINDYKPEYESKKAILDKLDEQILTLQEEIEETKKKYYNEALVIVQKENEEKINNANQILNEALNEQKKADDKRKETLRNFNETVDKIKEERKTLDKEMKEKKKLAEDFSLEKHKEADSYYKSKTEELTTREKDLSTKEKELDNLEKSLLEQENIQAELQTELDKRQSEAELGFQILLREERIKFDQELSKVKDEIANLGKKLIEGQGEIDDELKKYKEKELSTINENIKKEKNCIENEKEKIQKEIANIAKKNVELETAKEVIKTQKEAYDRKYDSLDDIAELKLQELYQEVINARDTFKNRCNELQKEVTDKQNVIVALTKKLKNGNGIEIDDLKKQIKDLNEEITLLKDNENSIIGKLKKYNVDSASLVKQLFKIEEYDNLLNEYESLLKTNQELNLQLKSNNVNQTDLELEAQRANQYQTNYEEALYELERLKKPTRKDRLSSFTSFTEFDKISKLDEYSKNLSELNWLKNIKSKMDAAEIKISSKLLYAFHTSVKIHDWSPLVVLAGVSGTGKSELPRQYAHHGGMNFISIPVKPDWDSMQSLFGYYNSIENKFEPTELSRAIYYMKNAQMKNTMLLVLLDEMNLAYVELYFSDLLSKFETSRGTNDIITYDINLGANEQPEAMEIGKNILWVGTMNEDETTKALSDKVVDRSTLLTFPRPRTLVSRHADIKIADTEKRLPYSLWEKWCTNTLSEEVVDKQVQIKDYRDIVESINDQMSKVNRNLGHRVWQSIELYIFSHPMVIANNGKGNEFKKSINSAFAEAVAFKIMPKLRGIEVSGESKRVLDAIGNIIKDNIPELNEDYEQAMRLSSRIFQWCSAKFMDVQEIKGE